MSGSASSGLGPNWGTDAMPGCAKTKSDLVVTPSGGRIFAFFCSERDHKPQNSGCGYTVQSFHTAWTVAVQRETRTIPIVSEPTHHRLAPRHYRELIAHHSDGWACRLGALDDRASRADHIGGGWLKFKREPSPAGERLSSDDHVESLPLVVFVLRKFGIGLTRLQGLLGRLYQLRGARQKGRIEDYRF